MSPTEVYEMYLALKRHFNNKTYDFVKYNGKVKTSQQAYNDRHDKALFEQLARRKHVKEIMIHAFFKNKNAYLTDMVGPDKESQALEFVKPMTSSYYFKREIGQFESLDDAFTVRGGQYPKIYDAYVEGRVSPQTLVICDDLANVFDYWSDKLADKFIWPDERFRLDKLRPFLKYDREKYKGLLLHAAD